MKWSGLRCTHDHADCECPTGGGATAERNGRAGGSPAEDKIVCTPGPDPNSSPCPQTDYLILDISRIYNVPVKVLASIAASAVAESTLKTIEALMAGKKITF